MLKIYKYIFRIRYAEAASSNTTRKLLRFEIGKMSIAVKIDLLCHLSCDFRHTLSFRMAVESRVKSFILGARPRCSRTRDALTGYDTCPLRPPIVVYIGNSAAEKGKRSV